jgi:hypothetical protein
VHQEFNCRSRNLKVGLGLCVLLALALGVSVIYDYRQGSSDQALKDVGLMFVVALAFFGGSMTFKNCSATVTGSELRWTDWFGRSGAVPLSEVEVRSRFGSSRIFDVWAGDRWCFMINQSWANYRDLVRALQKGSE